MYQFIRPLSILFLLAASQASVAQKTEPSMDEFFDVSQVRDIRLTIDEADWKELCSETRNMGNSLDLEERDSPYNYFKAGLTIDGVSVGKVGLRKKGFLGSQDSERPSLKVRFDKYKKNRRFAGLDRLTLNNNKQDRALLSQHLTYSSFRRVGLAAPRLSFAHVWVNDRDLGVYSNVESARPTFLKHHFGGDAGQMYEGTVVDFVEDRIVRFERKFGGRKPDDRSVLYAIAKLVENEEVDVQKLAEFVELEKFLTFWAMESLIGFWDGYCGNQNNYFIYSHHDDQRLHFIPWGADVAFDKQFIGQLFKAGHPESAAGFAMLPNRLYQNEATRKRYFEMLNGLLDSFWDEDRLIAETHRINALVKPHVGKSQQDYLKESESVRRFIKSRRAEIEKELKDGQPEIEFHRRKPMCARQVGEVTGALKTKWGSDEDSTEVTINLSLDGKPVQLANVDAKVFTGGGNPFMGFADAVTLKVSAVREDNQKPVVLSIIVSGLAFKPNHKNPATAHGGLVEGKSGFFRKPRSLGVAGKVTFEECGREDGDLVAGRFNLRLIEMDDGFPKRVKKSKSK
ncbi:MAG: CotH kinase family protein [Planctomycetaceae bacterium]